MFLNSTRALLRCDEEVLKRGKIVLRRLKIDASNVRCVAEFGGAHVEPEMGPDGGGCA